MTTQTTHRPTWRTSVALLTVPLALAACGGDDDADASSPPAATAAATSPETSVTATTSPTTAPATTVPDATAPPTTVPPTTVPPTTESCGSQCPLSDDQQTAVDGFFDAYNGDDWDTFRSVLVDEEVAWNFSPVIVQTEELMRYDFLWSAGLNETWVPERCVDQYGIISCVVIMEDDIHRSLAPFGFPASRCGITIEVDDGAVRPLRYDAILTGCHQAYDVAMHMFGAWFDEHYPELDPIHGVHYRAWNQTDETAPGRASEHLDEWLVAVQEFVDDGGDIMTVGR